MTAPVTRINTGDLLARFEWSVAAQGYEWTQSPLGPLLVERRGDGRPPKLYSPFTKGYAGLFRIFGETSPTPDGVLEFANQYGVLGGLAKLGFGVVRDIKEEIDPPHRTLNIKPDSTRPGELLETQSPQHRLWSWKHQILWMRRLLGVGQPSTNKGDIQREHFVNEMLRHTVSPRLERRTDGQLSLTFAPGSLAGALWLQLAMSLAEPKMFKACLCGKPIEISRAALTGRRSDAEFCSDACKSRDYRDRRRAAQQLAREGRTLTQIAEETHTPKDTVRRWLTP